jgi:zinc protease
MHIGIKKFTIILSIFFVALLIVILPFNRKTQKQHLSIEPILEEYSNKITTIKLKNGLNIILNKNTTIPKVGIQMTFQVGSANENRGQFGIAHSVKEMVGKYLNKLNMHGADFDATVNFDTSSYYFETVNTNYLPYLNLLAQTMQQIQFSAMQKSTQEPTHDLRNLLIKARKITFPSYHPYYHSLYDRKQNKAEFSQEDLQDFHNAYYQPSNATVCISGDFNEKVLLENIKDIFEPLESDNISKKPFFVPDYENPISQESTMYHDGKNAQIALFFKIPGIKSKKSYRAIMLAKLLGTGTGSRLYKLLIKKEKVAHSVECKAKLLHEAGIFHIIIHGPQESIHKIKPLVLQELSKIKEYGFSREEINQALQYQHLQLFMKLNNNKWLCSQLTESLLATNDAHNLLNTAMKNQKINNISLKRFVNNYFNVTKMNTLIMLPSKTKKPYKQNKPIKLHEINNSLPTHEVHNDSAYEVNLPDIQPVLPDRALTLTNGLTLLIRNINHLPWFSINLQLKNAPHLARMQDTFLVQLAYELMLRNKEQLDAYGSHYSYNSNGLTICGLNMNFEEIVHVTHAALSNKTLTKNSFRAAKKKIISTINKLEHDPLQHAHQLFRQHIYHNHEYGWSFEKAKKMISNLTKKNFASWFNKTFVGKNLIVSLVGNINITHVLNLAPELFSSLPTGKYKLQHQPKPNRSPIIIDKAVTGKTPIIFFGQALSVNILNPDYPGLLLLNDICYNSKENITGSWTFNTHKTPGYSFASLETDSSNLLQTETAIQMLLDNLSNYGVTDQQLVTAKVRLCSHIANSYENNVKIAQLYGYLENHSLGFNYHHVLMEKIKKISVQNINIICRKYAKLSDYSTIRIGHLK